MKLKGYTVAQLGTLINAGAMVYCTDETGGSDSSFL